MKGKGARRLLLKVSGEALAAESGSGISLVALERLAGLLASAAKLAELAVVIGGGNIVRGATSGLERVAADQMGMLATIINGLALQSKLEEHGIRAILQSAIPTPFTEPLDRRRAIQALERGELVIFAGGTGNPFVTTDTAAAIRASEIGAKLLLKGTKVDGVYTADPAKDPSARKLDRLSYQEVLARDLGVMDLAAIELCRLNKIPILVFNLFKARELERAVRGESVGTIVTSCS
ncbi:MAG: UMP kinase [Candidatus Acetothermia bacterium]|jgi:uridylate kinase|nr:UMP kinase [Candidatus Acetothermia bacterium]MDH7505660.1 UMP kinase [Candidatus Acetothermia bacterium]